MFKSWLFLGILAVFAAFSQAEGSCKHWNEVVREILANESYCVKAEREGKIYLNSENSQSLEEGLYLDLNGRDVLPLSFVFSDGDGCFIPSGGYVGEPPMPIYCPKCKFYHAWPPCSITGD